MGYDPTLQIVLFQYRSMELEYEEEEKIARKSTTL